MKTADLIAALAADSAPAAPAASARRLLAASCVGVLMTVLILALWLGFQPLAAAARARWFWMKAAYAISLALAGFLVLIPLSRPGARVGWAGLGLAGASLGLMASMAAWRMITAPPGAALALWLGQTWMLCPWRILALAVPVFLCLAWGLRRLAPTELRLAGAAAGLLAGALAALAYSLYCAETSAAFVATWYTLGVAASALCGALAGPRLLRW